LAAQGTILFSRSATRGLNIPSLFQSQEKQKERKKPLVSGIVQKKLAANREVEVGCFQY
jgi:hypothetical protein